MATPTELTYHSKRRVLTVTFGDTAYDIPAELLRVFSPSAEVRGHGAGERTLQMGKKYVEIKRIDPVGNYAIRLVFDDGHDTGIFAWDYLEDLGKHESSYWADYDAELKAANASRLPTISTIKVGQWTPDE